jgi:NADPH2:quinone reductase
VKAAWYRRHGPAHQVIETGDLPTPDPQPGEVLVKVAYSGVNNSDCIARAGVRPLTSALVVPHSDGSGEIVAVASGVDVSRIGERVWLWNAQWGRPMGTAAEFVSLPSNQAVPLPDGVDLPVGAMLGIPAMTAWRVVDFDGGVAGQTVLISGAAGMVGHYAVQFARLSQARTVIATVGSEEQASVAQAAGADHVVNYRTDAVGKAVSALTGGAGVDRIIEVNLAANFSYYPEALKPWGKAIVYGVGGPTVTLPGPILTVRAPALQFFIVYTLPADVRARGIAAINAALANGSLRHRPYHAVALAKTAEAHVAVEAGADGKVLIDLQQPMEDYK